MLLIHRYHVFSRACSYVAFRGTYMARLRTFLNAAYAACLQSRNRRRARSLASQMSPEFPVGTHSQEPANLSQPSTSHHPSSQFRASTLVAAIAAESLSGRRAVPALMDLTLPQFAVPDL